jgi:hypothetical protein
MSYAPVESDLIGQICWTKNYRERGSGYGRVIEVLESEDGDRVFDIALASHVSPSGKIIQRGGRYMYPRHKIRVIRNQIAAENRVTWVTVEASCYRRDRRLVKGEDRAVNKPPVVNKRLAEQLAERKAKAKKKRRKKKS